MGILTNLLISIVHLAMVIFDLIFAGLLVKAVYEKWKQGWLKAVFEAVDPVIGQLLTSVQRYMLHLTGKNMPDMVVISVLLIVMSLIKLIIAEIFS